MRTKTAAVAVGVVLSIAAPAHADEEPAEPAAALAPEVQEFLEWHYQQTLAEAREFLEWHYQQSLVLRWLQVTRWEETGLIHCESGGDWHINTGNGYFGGAQMGMPFWRAYGGPEFAPRPDLAEPWQQATILDRFVDSGGSFSQAFPACSRRLNLAA